MEDQDRNTRNFYGGTGSYKKNMNLDVALIDPMDMWAWDDGNVPSYRTSGDMWRHEHRYMQYVLLCDYADKGGNVNTYRLKRFSNNTPCAIFKTRE